MTPDHTASVSMVEAGVDRNLELNIDLNSERAFQAAAEHVRLLNANLQSTELISQGFEPARSSLSKSQAGYVAIFRLVSLDLVERRFGISGLCQLRQVILRCLLKNLQPEDRIYDLAQHTFVAVCDRRAHPKRQEQLTAEICRILARNRDFPIQVGERKIMLRIPISVTIHSVSQFGSPSQLRELLLNHPIPVQSSPSTTGSEMSDLAVVPGEVFIENPTGAEK